MAAQVAILIAEDEALIRLGIAESLRDEGFDVMEAEHAESALNALQVHACSIDVLFTDIQMPGIMDGLALAHHTARSWPWIALLITSGHPLAHLAGLPDKSRFLPKPYHPHHVIRHIREMAPL